MLQKLSRKLTLEGRRDTAGKTKQNKQKKKAEEKWNHDGRLNIMKIFTTERERLRCGQ